MMCCMGMSEEWTSDTTMGEGWMPGGGRILRDSWACADLPDPPDHVARRKQVDINQSKPGFFPQSKRKKSSTLIDLSSEQF